jgi:1,4-dihydroxy-2-naphthoate polyprenyltransferase
LEHRELPDIDYQRLANFRNAIITTIGDDGYPFSVTTSYHLTLDKKIILEKPSLPSKLDGRKVNVLFNHITGVPTGGYTDRRYMLLWGTTHEDHGKLRLEPEKLSEWNEKILPFPEYCAKVAPQGAKYLEKLQPSVEA